MSECAVRADGTLKDASEIDWFNDVDDDKPIPDLPANQIPSSSSTTLHPFFTGSRAPAIFVAGTRRSARVPRPSTRMLDPDNIEGSSITTAAKRKATDNMRTTGRLVVRKVSTEATSSDDDGSDDDANPSVIVDGDVMETEDDPELAYMSTKVMGDADREVSYTSLNFCGFS